jgi:hypothetical protein
MGRRKSGDWERILTNVLEEYYEIERLKNGDCVRIRMSRDYVQGLCLDTNMRMSLASILGLVDGERVCTYLDVPIYIDDAEDEFTIERDFSRGAKVIMTSGAKAKKKRPPGARHSWPDPAGDGFCIECNLERQRESIARFQYRYGNDRWILSVPPCSGGVCTATQCTERREPGRKECFKHAVQQDFAMRKLEREGTSGF